MKKIVVLLLMLIYGVATTGATVYVHFCCGKFLSISFTERVPTKCAKTPSFNKKTCCVDKLVHYSASPNTLTAEESYSITNSITALEVPLNANYQFPHIDQLVPTNEWKQLPPLITSKPKLYLQYSVFRI